MLTATTFQFGATPAADAHAIRMPSKVQPVPVDNVRNFGAMGNGVTDDSTAIQNAANDAAARHIGLFFPAGTYLHASPVTFNGISVSGAGAASVLVANNPANCAVVLTGANVSLQNMMISTHGLAGSSSLLNPNSATLLIQSATSFTVAGSTIVTGTNMWGALVLMSTVGAINSVAFDGTGNANDIGVEIDQGDNVTVANSLFQNESMGVQIVPNGGPSQFISVVSNTIGNVTWPTTQFGVYAVGVNTLDVAQNTIQMLNSSGTYPINLANVNDFTVAGNNTWGGNYAITSNGAGPGNNIITQNIMHNTGGIGVYINNNGNSALQVVGNVFGEIGIMFSSSVILISGADSSGATTFVENNSYQGHNNFLINYVYCTFTAPHIPAGNVTGNTQTQTILGNHI
jgi:hypothetical protein